MQNFWQPTRTGRRVPLACPTAADIDPEDLAEPLAHLVRYCGHAGHYTSAQHLCLVSDLCPAHLRLWGLLHEAHEAYTGHLSAPAAGRLCALAGHGQPQEALVRRVQHAVCVRYGLDWPEPHLVRWACKQVTAAEIHDLLPAERERLPDWGLPAPPLSLPTITPWDAPRAAAEFLARLEALTSSNPLPLRCA